MNKNKNDVFSMTDLTRLLLDYALQERLPRYLDQTSYDAAKRAEAESLAALEDGLPDACAAPLERFREALEDSRSLELQAMFLAASSMARELAVL